VIYKVIVADGITERTCCLKVFLKDWTTPYNLEITAYAYLRHAGLKYFIPKVLARGQRTVSGWGLEDVDGETEGGFYGILMEWIDGSEMLSDENVTLEHAQCLVRGLMKIHEAGVLHNDAFPKNMLVVPGTGRAVWVDFSCAKIGLPDEFEYEMRVGGLIPIQLVFWLTSVR